MVFDLPHDRGSVKVKRGWNRPPSRLDATNAGSRQRAARVPPSTSKAYISTKLLLPASLQALGAV